MARRERNLFSREMPEFKGTDIEYNRLHYDTYGREERMTAAGRHAPGGYNFPEGSVRDRHHEDYH